MAKSLLPFAPQPRRPNKFGRYDSLCQLPLSPPLAPRSLHLGTINDSGLAQLESWIATTLAAKGEPDDSLIVLPVNPDQIQRLRVYGKNELDKDELSGGKSTLIL